MAEKNNVSIAVILLVTPNSVGFSEGFAKYPYLQNVKTDEITICWKILQSADTSDPNLYRLEYGMGNYSNVAPYPVSYPTDSQLFQLTLTSLLPGTLYQYRVRSGSQWSQEAAFSTAVRSNEPFAFAVYADT
ncbi:MAG TPA: fibronectin type III domain-containing protein, partial [Sedimentisphaerales bacterium]|nr:fibronectin type III domain-containing protein [Sedimentisphaerales bacterium]